MLLLLGDLGDDTTSFRTKMHVLLTCQSVAANTKDKSGKMMLYHRLNRQATTTFPLTFAHILLTAK
jgi:hypothetical protein